MSNYLVPSSDTKFIEEVARSIAKDRMRRESDAQLQETFGISLELHGAVEERFDAIFETLWNNPAAEEEREAYRADARAAISTINLKLLTMTT